MIQKFSNHALGKLASNISSGDLTLVLEYGQGANFPALDITKDEFFIAKIYTGASSFEVVRVINVTNDTLRIERGQEDTDAATWPKGATVEMFISKGTLENLVQKAERFGHFKAERHVSFVGQTVYNLREGSYPVGQNALEVSINGVRQDPTVLTEIDGTTFSLPALYRSEIVDVRYLTTDFVDRVSAASVSYFTPNGKTIDLQNYIRSLEERLVKLEK